MYEICSVRHSRLLSRICYSNIILGVFSAINFAPPGGGGREVRLCDLLDRCDDRELNATDGWGTFSSEVCIEEVFAFFGVSMQDGTRLSQPI